MSLAVGAHKGDESWNPPDSKTVIGLLDDCSHVGTAVADSAHGFCPISLAVDVLSRGNRRGLVDDVSSAIAIECPRRFHPCLGYLPGSCLCGRDS